MEHEPKTLLTMLLLPRTGLLGAGMRRKRRRQQQKKIGGKLEKMEKANEKMISTLVSRKLDAPLKRKLDRKRP